MGPGWSYSLNIAGWIRTISFWSAVKSLTKDSNRNLLAEFLIRQAGSNALVFNELSNKTGRYPWKLKLQHFQWKYMIPL